MSDLIIAAYGRQNDAFLAGESLAALQQEAGVEPEDIVVITRDATRRVSVHQSIDLATGQPLGGGLWGALIGMLFLDRGPPDPQGRGLAAQFEATGIEPAFLRDVAKSLEANGAAVGLRVRMLGADRVKARLQSLRGEPRVLITRLSAATEEALCDLQGQIPQSAVGASWSDHPA